MADVPDYRLALRTVEEWGDEDRMDDIVVHNVSCFRMEQMSARNWWLQCYLDDDPDGDYITFAISFDWKTREIVCRVTEYPLGDHVYEGPEHRAEALRLARAAQPQEGT